MTTAPLHWPYGPPLRGRSRRARWLTNALAFAGGIALGVVVLSLVGAAWLFRQSPTYDFEDWRAGVAQGEGLVSALDEWRRRQGAYPERLEDLVPTELRSIPDPIVGVPAWSYLRSPDGRGYRLRFESASGYPACTRYERFCVSPFGECDPERVEEVEALLPAAVAWRAERGERSADAEAFGPDGAWRIRAEFPSAVLLRRDGTVVAQGWDLDR